MAISKLLHATIAGITSVVPSNKEDILDSTLFSDDEKQALIKHTGIRYKRRVYHPSETVQAYFHQAIQHLLAKLNWKKEEIGLLICVTQTPQVPIPSIACLLHDQLNLEQDTLCYDINSGCSGFVYGLHTVFNLLNSLEDEEKKAILVCGDLSSQLIDVEDKATQPIFSDGVSAIGIERKVQHKSITTGIFNLETVGKGKDAIYTEKIHGAQPVMRLNGIDVFNYSVKFVPSNILKVLKAANKKTEEIDAFVFHQANKVINNSIAKKLKLSGEKVPSSLYDYGNMASASIPITIGARSNELLKENGWMLVAGFGVGFSLASAVIRFDAKNCPFPEEFKIRND
jgi:3-oxoacyl-[acyl-carrier-protein] synthase-3